MPSFTFSILPAAGSLGTAALPAGADAGISGGRDFRLDSNGDLSLEEGDLVLISGAEAVASDLSARLQTFAGEYFLDANLGMPYLQEVFGKRPLARIEEVCRRAILETPGVGRIEKLNVLKTGRELKVSFRVMTDFTTLIDAALTVGG